VKVDWPYAIHSRGSAVTTSQRAPAPRSGYTNNNGLASRDCARQRVRPAGQRGDGVTELEEADGTLTVQVAMTGPAAPTSAGGSGLTGLRDRVEAVGGSMTLDSPAGAGTVLTVLLPVTADDH
jgi:hypothetical protein